MDYEKLHKDTINRLQQMVSCGNITPETARRICADFEPESEDEKVIKSITRLVKAFYDCNFPTPEGLKREDILAWLEKQGEHNPADKIEPDTLIEESYQQQADDLIDMVTEKPAWSEEDEKKMKACIKVIEDCYKWNNIEGIKDWFKSIKDRICT